MIKKKFDIMPAIILILISIVFYGCSKAPEPEAAKTGTANQSTATSNGSNAAVNPATAPTPVVSYTQTKIESGNSSAPVNGAGKKPMPPVKDPTPQIGSGAEDLLLFTQARGALSSDAELLNAVIIELKEGTATLTGNVSSQAQKAKAAQLVQSVKGIKSVKNNLRAAS